MCGFVGVATNRLRPVSVSDAHLRWMRDLLTHRGVDDAGLWRAGNFAVGHRRLAIVDQAHGQQPWVLHHAAQPQVLSYNGQLYNWRELRAELAALGVTFETDSDTEVVARALQAWGIDALARFRGMFALAWFDNASQQLLLARDPLGIKPLYYAKARGHQGEELVFGSEPMAVLAHPAISAQPDWVSVSAYLSTIRPTLGSRTLFEGLHTLLPGEYQYWDLRADSLVCEKGLIPLPEIEVAANYDEAVEQLRDLVRESVALHLMGDAQPAGFLSGGLDSSIITQLASDNLHDFQTFAAATADQQMNDGDYAQMLAAELGVHHQRMDMTPAVFRQTWGWMIERMGMPLSTPNEVAILHLSLAASTVSKVVLSGEGADELFAGYGGPLNTFARYFEHQPHATAQGMASEYLRTMSWISPALKSHVLTPGVLSEIAEDQYLQQGVADAFHCLPGQAPGLRNVLHAQRQLNLTGQLGRLDTATMLGTIEGRTPLADSKLAAFAQKLPVQFLFTPGGDETSTKRILRDAFAGQLPGVICRRPKASFPLPFQQWMNEQSAWLTQSEVIREVFSMPALQSVAADPNGHWMAAWPMMNLAYWLELHWGSGELRQAA